MARGGEPDPLIGAEFGGYRIERRLGRGGMGVVYLAESLALGRKVALKLLPPELGDDDRYRARFLRESRLAASLDHPNVVPIYDAGEVGGRLYIAMRYVDGTDLAHLLRDGPLPIEETLRILAGVASALDVAHAHGLVHRDVKPANILLTDPPRHPYLADFGLTKVASSGPSAATIGEVVGTPDYVAPEQIRGEPITGSADVYSLACVAYECLVGDPPFRGTGDLAAVWAHLQEEPVPPSEHRQDLPAALDTILARALAKDPADRYASCAEFVEAVASALGEPLSVARSSRSRPRRGSSSRTPWPPALVVGISILVLGTGAAILTRREPSPIGSSGSAGPTTSATASAAPSGLAAIEPESVAFIAPNSGDLLGTLRLPGETVDAAFADGSFWLRGTDPDELYRIDPASRALTKTIVWGFASPNWYVVDGGSIWVTDRDAPRAIRIDALTGAKADELTLPSDPKNPIQHSVGIAVGAGSVWVAGFADVDSIVARFDRATGALQQVIKVPYANLLYFGNGSLWAIARPGEIHRIDPASNEIVATVILPGARDLTYLTFANGFAWGAEPSTGTVWKVDPNGSIAATYTTERGASPLGYADPTVWVANSRAGTLTGIDPTTGKLQTLAVGHYPAALATDGATLMVAIERSAEDEISALPGSVLRVSSDHDPLDRSPDTAWNAGWAFRGITFATCAKLLNYRDAGAPDGWSLQPEIAAAMPELSADALTYTFAIRPGFAFSPPSNAPITAETFRFTIERLLDPTYGPNTRGMFHLGGILGATDYNAGKTDHIRGLSVTADGRLRITLTAPEPDFLQRLAAHEVCPVPVGTPAVPGGVDPLPTSGPYYFSHHDAKVAVLTRNPNYPGPRTRAYDSIAIELSVDTGEAVARVDAGELDVVLMPPGGLFNDLGRLWGADSKAGRAGDQRFYAVPTTTVLFLSMNREAGALRDPTLRRALELGIDRVAAAAVSKENPIGRLLPPGVPGSGRDVVPVDASGVPKARELMRGRAVTVKLAYDEFCSDCPAFAKAIAPRLHDIGFTLKAEAIHGAVCSSVLCNQDLASRYDLVIGVAQARYPDPYSILWLLGDSAVPSSWLTRADREAIAHVGMLTGDVRLAAAAALADRFVLDDPLIVPVSTLDAPAYIGPRVGCRVMQPAQIAVDLSNLCPAPGTPSPS